MSSPIDGIRFLIPKNPEGQVGLLWYDGGDEGSKVIGRIFARKYIVSYDGVNREYVITCVDANGDCQEIFAAEIEWI